MKNIYKTLAYYPGRVGGGDNQATYVENQINQMAATGWEYVNSIGVNQYALVLLVFRQAL